MPNVVTDYVYNHQVGSSRVSNMDELSGEHVAWLRRQKDRADNTIASRIRVLNSMPTAGTATRESITAWWEARADLASGTRAVDLSHLRDFYKWCVIEYKRPDDPTVHIRSIHVENTLPIKIPNGEIERLLSKLPADLQRAVMLGAFAGLRVSESAKVEWSDIDSTDDTIRVRKSKGGKTRAVNVSPDLIRRLAADGTEGNVVTASAAALSASQLQRRLNRAMRTAGADFTSHDLRHRWGTTAYRASQDLLAVAEMMGHSSINTTKIYASADSEVKRKIASAVML